MVFGYLASGITSMKNSPAPDFALPDQHGKIISLADFKGKKNVILYFYPKDDTPGCTAQACTFRDQYEIFQKEGAEVLGVSSDSSKSHSRFSSKHHLPFPILSDEGGVIRKLYKVSSTMGIIPGRVTFVIDKQGMIRNIFSSQFNAKKHVEEALKTLQSL